MSLFMEAETNSREIIKEKLRQNFDGKIVRKDLTKKIKEGANVPVYVLEFLLGQYCSSDDPELIESGMQNVKHILADNFVRPDEAQKVLSVLRRNGSHTVIDMITVELDIKKDRYLAQFSNLGLMDVPIDDEYPERFDRLLCGGIWCIVQLEYNNGEEGKPNGYPITIYNLTPIQMPNIEIKDLKEGRKAFTKDEWIDVILRSIGMEPDSLKPREKQLLLLRCLPLIENNYNLCELGPRSTGKSHLFKEISPNSILVSGGQTTVANLFYNMARKTVGLVGLWDCVAFDEVAGIKFKDKDGIQIMKDYMASGSFARGKEEKAASASMVFVGNINQSVDVLLKTSSLFDPFPPEMGTDTAFLDRIHCYLPGWEIPKFRPEHFTGDYGFITDYFAEWVREMRKEQFGDSLDKYFRLGKNLNQRDTIAVRRTLDGYLKLVYPEENKVFSAAESVMTGPLAQAGIRLTMTAVPMNELLRSYYRMQDRDCDMLFMASNYDVVFDPSLNVKPDGNGINAYNFSAVNDPALYQSALRMRNTPAGDLLGYVTNWIAFQTEFQRALPAIGLYSNVYFDFYPQNLQNYDAAGNIGWSKAMVSAIMGDIPEPVETELEDGTEIEIPD